MRADPSRIDLVVAAQRDVGHDRYGYRRAELGPASGGIGSTGSPKSVAGLVKTGLNFFSQNHVTVNPNSTLNFGKTKSFTVDGWIKGHSSPIVSNHTSPNTAGFALRHDGMGRLSFDIGIGGPQLLTWQGPPIDPDKWTFVAAAVDRLTAVPTVTLHTAPLGGTVASAGPFSIANGDAGINLALRIGGCFGNPSGCDMAIDEVEIFDSALKVSDLQDIVDAGSAGKCTPQQRGMTWLAGSVNSTTGTITVGCGSAPPNRCDPITGDRPCTDTLPLLCFRPSGFPAPASVNNNDIYNKWSGGIVATSVPVQASMFNGSLSAANARCANEFDSSWRVAKFHDGWGWNFQAYGNVGNPSSQFWVHSDGQPKGTCFPNP